jgi:MoxR-like ATPase
MAGTAERVAAFQRDHEQIRREVGKVIVGQDSVVEGVLAALLVGGHCLLEGVPGLGKTRLVHALAAVLDLRFSRIQFTPDLMPADIVGTQMIAEDTRGGRHFEFQEGPIFSHILLADEINRATPKTQSALLQAMAERSVTVARTTYPLEAPFFVLATQNPLEMEGTYPLPEAQLDRFLFKLQVDFPSREELHRIVSQTTGSGEAEPRKVADRAKVLEMSQTALECDAAPHVIDLAIRIVQGTHPESEEAPPITRKYVRFGASPRGAQAMVRAAKVLAVVAGRFAIADEDIVQVARPALRHRLILNFEGEAEGVAPDAILDDVIAHARKRRTL